MIIANGTMKSAESRPGSKSHFRVHLQSSNPYFKENLFFIKIESISKSKIDTKISKADVPFNYPNGPKIKVTFCLKFSAFRGPESQTFRQICKIIENVPN